MTDPATNSRESIGPRLRALHILTLSCLAFAQPLLDLLGRTAEFFVIRRVGPPELLAMLGLILVALPLPLLAIPLALGRLHGRSGRVASAIVIGLLAGLIALRAVSATSLLDGLPAIAVAAVAALAAGLTYHRHDLFRTFVTYLSPALLVVPLVFVLQSNVRRAISPPAGSHALSKSGAHAPIFFLIFDELSFASVVNEQGVVDATRYPNLAKLARSATWYRNAHTVADTTNIAIPAMLSSRFPEADALPLLADHPVNLFTLFGGDYKVWADEPITRLCPQTINIRGQLAPPASGRFTSLVLDLSVVWLHLELPPSYRQRLPPISRGWEGFAAGTTRAPVRRAPLVQPKNADEFFELALGELGQGDRAERFRELLSSIDPNDDRILYFAHTMLPHPPWEYTSTGRLYTANDGKIHGLVDEVWAADPEFARLGLTRHLMQVEFLDRLIGELIQKLESESMYEKSLIVLVADHGASFRAGEKRRALSVGNAPDIISVPLIIKAPGQTAGEIIDAPVSTLDILPTLMDILNVRGPANLEGHSTRRPRPDSPRTIRVSTRYDGEQVLSVSDLDARKYESVRTPAARIGPISDPYRFSRAAPHPELLGRAVNTLPSRDGQLEATLLDVASLREYDPDAALVPSFVSGAVRPDTKECCDMAIAVNGTIVATAAVGQVSENYSQFGAIVADGILRKGSNDVELFRVVAPAGATGPALVLERTESGRNGSYAIAANTANGTQLLRVNGRDFKLGRTLDGWVERVNLKGATLAIDGWAVDRARKQLVSEVVVFYRDRFLVSGATLVEKPYVAEGFGNPSYAYAGFSFAVPASLAPNVESNGLRLFALTDQGDATELGVPMLRVETKGDAEYLLAGNGMHYSIVDGTLDGVIEAVDVEGDGVSIRGWAANRVNGVPADRIVVVLDGRIVREFVAFEPRPDLGLPGGGAPDCGFRLHFAGLTIDSAMEAFRSGRARLFALSGGGFAGELPRPSTPGPQPPR